MRLGVDVSVAADRRRDVAGRPRLGHRTPTERSIIEARLLSRRLHRVSPGSPLVLFLVFLFFFNLRRTEPVLVGFAFSRWCACTTR